MSSIPLSLILFALYIYIPSLFFKLGVSQNNEIRQSSPDKYSYLVFYFTWSFLVNAVLVMFSCKFFDFKLEIVFLALSSHSDSNLRQAVSELDLLSSALYLVLSYIFNFCFGSRFSSYNSILKPPSNHLLPWQRALNLKEKEKSLKIEVNIMTNSKVLYSGELSDIVYGKDEQIEFVTLLKPTRRYLESDLNFSTSTEFPSFRFMVCYSDISNINIVDLKLKANSRVLLENLTIKSNNEELARMLEKVSEEEQD